MTTIVVCISLALVACNHGQIKSHVNDYFRLFDVRSGGRQLRSAAVVGDNRVTGGFYLPASSGGNQAGRGHNQADRGGGGGSNFQVWNHGDGVNASAFSQPGPIGGASGFSLSVAGAGSYGRRASSGGSGGSSNQGGSGGNGGRNFQGWGAGAGGVSNQGDSEGGSSSNLQIWDADTGGLSNQDGSGAAGGSSAPNSADSGAGGSGRIVGFVLEGIDQSIQIAQYHQTSSELGLSAGGYPGLTSAPSSATVLLGKLFI